VVLTIYDGGGNIRVNATVATAATTAAQPFTCIEMVDLNIPLVNGSNNVTVALSSNLTSGEFLVSVALQ
jgi:hypothetical protein